jgi:AhpD family alkylhydroperoxidase
MSILSDVEREHVAIGAAVGAGCRPCTQYHIKAAVEAGLSTDDILVDVEEAELVRIEAATSMADYARSKLGGAETHNSSACSPTTQAQALAQVGAATGSNAGRLLKDLLPRARGLGLSNDRLAEAVSVAGKVKSVAADFYDKDAERALGDTEMVVAVSDDDGCADMSQGYVPAETSKEQQAVAAQSCC